MIFSQISIILSKFRILIFSVLSVVASVLAVSCDEMQVETGITISNRQAVYKAGQETVSISASGEWALSLFYYGSQQGWATLSQTSGRGSKDVILEYDENGTSRRTDDGRYIYRLLPSDDGNGNTYRTYANVEY